MKTLEDFITAAQIAGSYMITLTTLEGGRLNHNLLVNNFPNGDCLHSHVEIEKLIVEHLKNKQDSFPLQG